jgi:hypothetical protein
LLLKHDDRGAKSHRCEVEKGPAGGAVALEERVDLIELVVQSGVYRG